MKLVLQTSSGFAQLALFDGVALCACLPDSISGSGHTGPRVQDRDLASLTRELLDQAGIGIEQVSSLAVDIGPGRLAATRMAVAFVNALGFARRLPIQALPAFSLLSAEAATLGHKRALVFRKASGRRYYWGVMAAETQHDQGLVSAKDLPQLTARLARLDGALVSDQPLDPTLTQALGARTSLLVTHASPATLAPLLATWPLWKAGATPYPVPLTESAFNAQLE